jgi:hypothetical protein
MGPSRQNGLLGYFMLTQHVEEAQDFWGHLLQQRGGPASPPTLSRSGAANVAVREPRMVRIQIAEKRMVERMWGLVEFQ